MPEDYSDISISRSLCVRLVAFSLAQAILTGVYLSLQVASWIRQTEVENRTFVGVFDIGGPIFNILTFIALVTTIEARRVWAPRWAPRWVRGSRKSHPLPITDDPRKNAVSRAFTFHFSERGSAIVIDDDASVNGERRASSGARSLARSVAHRSVFEEKVAEATEIADLADLWRALDDYLLGQGAGTLSPVEGVTPMAARESMMQEVDLGAPPSLVFWGTAM